MRLDGCDTQEIELAAFPTTRRRIAPKIHGTEWAYNNSACRCEACRAAHREYWHHKQARAEARFRQRREALERPAQVRQRCSCGRLVTAAIGALAPCEASDPRACVNAPPPGAA